MTWFGYLWLVVLAVSTGVQFMTVGEPREPMTASSAFIGTAVAVLIFWGAATVGVFPR
jgi:hypothetical protein